MRVLIKIQGNISKNWIGWFGSLDIIQEEQNTILSGIVVDESEFHGILNQIRDLNFKLISAQIIDRQ